MSAFSEDEIAWDDLPVEDRLRDCFAEAETAMAEATELLGTCPSDPLNAALAEIALRLQTISGSVRSMFDRLRGSQDAEK